ncbi:MAG TPA: hypothetical protein VHB21_19085 [Minicystis sp.]|nr:hypothetical protein [Minicystis sp.]
MTRKKRAKSSSSPRTTGELRLRTDPRQERRYEPKSPVGVVLSVVAMSLGAVAVGAGTYGQWMRAEALGPHKLAPWLLGGGAALFLLVALFGQRLAKPVRVGDAGLAVENDTNDVERIAWCDVVRALLSKDMIVVQSNGRSIAVPVKAHAAAAARLVAELKARVPDKVEGELELPAPDDADGELVKLEPPQIAGQRCKASDRLITFENDARLCGRCGEVYHKDSVPKACLTCGAELA